jgi:hypothetical protein
MSADPEIEPTAAAVHPGMTRDDTLTLIAIAWLAFIVADVACAVSR